MANHTIQDLNQLEDFNPNENLILIQSIATDGDLYKMNAAAFVQSSIINSEYMDLVRSDIGFQSKTIKFERDYLLNQQSTLDLTLDFACNVRLPSVKVVKNSGDNFCRFLTYNQIRDIQIDSSVETLDLSIYSLSDNQETKVSADIQLSSGINSKISFSNLKLLNTTDSASTNSAYCCAKLKSIIIQ